MMAGSYLTSTYHKRLTHKHKDDCVYKFYDNTNRATAMIKLNTCTQTQRIHTRLVQNYLQSHTGALYNTSHNTAKSTLHTLDSRLTNCVVI